MGDERRVKERVYMLPTKRTCSVSVCKTHSRHACADTRGVKRSPTQKCTDPLFYVSLMPSSLVVIMKVSSIMCLIFGPNKFHGHSLVEPNLWRFTCLSPSFYGLTGVFQYLWSWNQR